jgi:hypothetical protein
VALGLPPVDPLVPDLRDLVLHQSHSQFAAHNSTARERLACLFLIWLVKNESVYKKARKKIARIRKAIQHNDDVTLHRERKGSVKINVYPAHDARRIETPIGKSSNVVTADSTSAATPARQHRNPGISVVRPKPPKPPKPPILYLSHSLPDVPDDKETDDAERHLSPFPHLE